MKTLYTVYCPECGHEMKVQTDGKYYCSNCGLYLTWKQVQDKNKNNSVNIGMEGYRRKGDNNGQ